MRLRSIPFVATVSLTVALTSALAGCQASGPSAERQRLDRLELRVQQLEQRQANPQAADTADKAGKPPAGVVKSLTYRTGAESNSLRIYWADGSQSDLECTQEQSTLACG
jgi:hypothetical protein